jgi:tetratricopeptide (TPR) repeat protein
MAAPDPKAKLALLEQMAAKDPKQPFPRYGVAMELASQGRLADSAAAFAALAKDLPDYVPTYFQAGKVLEKLDRLDEARDFYGRGIAAATKAGNGHARDELEAALSILG